MTAEQYKPRGRSSDDRSESRSRGGMSDRRNFDKNYDDSDSGLDKRRGGKRFPRRKICIFCADKSTYIDYKDLKRLKKFVTERGKILPRRISGNCAFHQRKLTIAVKKARNIALLPFKVE